MLLVAFANVLTVANSFGALNRRVLQSVRFLSQASTVWFTLHLFTLLYTRYSRPRPWRQEGEINTPQTEYLEAYK